MPKILWMMIATASCAVAPQANAAAKGLDAKDIGEAAVMMATEIGTWDGWRRECSVVRPADARAISSYYVRWLGDNRAEILAMRSYAKYERKSPDAFDELQKIQKPDAVGSASRSSGLEPAQLCLAAFQKMHEGGVAFARKYPGAARLLKDYYVTHVLTRHELRTYDNPMGCLKSALNQNVGYDAARSVCQCNWRVMNASLSQPEWEEYEAAVGTKPPQELREMPQIKRNLSKLASCAAELTAR